MPADPAPHSSASDELPLIEIDVNGAWRQGRLRAWDPRPDGLFADVIYQNDGSYLDRRLPAERIRPAAS